MVKIKYFSTSAIIFSAIFLITSCQEDNDDFGANGNGLISTDEIAALPQDVSSPSDNLMSESKIELGRLLFWDPILSGSQDISCASCHHPDLGYADGRALSSGVGGIGLGLQRENGTLVERNAPTIINTAFNGIEIDGIYDPSQAPMFWDNRASSLEEQAILPILSKEEMRGELIAEADILNILIDRISNVPEYNSLFEIAFGNDQINDLRIAQALAAFQRSLVANNSRFDQYMRGNTNAMNNNEIEGMNTFIDVGCANCHNGPMFSDFELHTLSVPDHESVTDDGATGNFDFRTPTLRNLEFTAPYMHNGSFTSLMDVLEFYDDISDGNGDSENPNVEDDEIDEDAVDLDLGRGEIREIILFLNTLNDPNFDRTIPANVPSGLEVGGNIN